MRREPAATHDQVLQAGLQLFVMRPGGLAQAGGFEHGVTLAVLTYRSPNEKQRDEQGCVERIREDGRYMKQGKKGAQDLGAELQVQHHADRNNGEFQPRPRLAYDAVLVHASERLAIDPTNRKRIVMTEMKFAAEGSHDSLYIEVVTMRLWLIRHAVAVEADAFDGSDLDRPLTPAGRRVARAFFARLAFVRPPPERVISSAAVRARQTAELFCRAYGVPRPLLDDRLNPGARFKSIRAVVSEAMEATVSSVAIVGHEPDFSRAVSQWTSGGALDLAFKKCGLVELELRPGGPARLIMALPPDLVATARRPVHR